MTGWKRKFKKRKYPFTVVGKTIENILDSVGAVTVESDIKTRQLVAKDDIGIATIFKREGTTIYEEE